MFFGITIKRSHGAPIDLVQHKLLLLLLSSRKPAPQDQVGKTELFINCFRNPTSNCAQTNIAVYLDFSKSLDTVNRNILMSKLVHYGIRGVMQNWFKSYLSNKKQLISVKTPVPPF